MKQLNEKMREHLTWSNKKPMRSLGGLNPLQLLEQKMAVSQRDRI